MLRVILEQFIIILGILGFMYYSIKNNLNKERVIFILGILAVILSTFATFNFQFLISFLLSLILLSLLMIPYINKLINKKYQLPLKVSLVLLNLIVLYLIYYYFIISPNIYYVE